MQTQNLIKIPQHVVVAIQLKCLPFSCRFCLRFCNRFRLRLYHFPNHIQQPMAVIFNDGLIKSNGKMLLRNYVGVVVFGNAL